LFVALLRYFSVCDIVYDKATLGQNNYSDRDESLRTDGQ